MPVCFYHVTFLKDFFRGGVPLNIFTILMQCLLNVLVSVFSSFILHKGLSLLSMKPLIVRKGLMNIQKLLLVFISFSLMLSKCFFKDFLRNDTYVSLFLICQYIFRGRILIHFVFQFASCVDSFLKFFGYKRRVVAS